MYEILENKQLQLTCYAVGAQVDRKIGQDPFMFVFSMTMLY